MKTNVICSGIIMTICIFAGGILSDLGIEGLAASLNILGVIFTMTFFLTFVMHVIGLLIRQEQNETQKPDKLKGNNNG